MCCCAVFIVKFILFFVNFVISLAGLALIGLGVAFLLNFSDLLSEVSLNAIPISVIVIGSVIFAISFFGCCGAITESRCLLIMYAVCMAILAAAKIVVAVLYYQSVQRILDTLEDWLRDAFANSNLDEVFHVFELAFRCCGTDGPDSYADYPALPPTCCASPFQADGVQSCARDAAFPGCVGVVNDFFSSFGDAIGAVLIAVIIVELIAMIFGSFLASSIKTKKRGYYA